MKTKNWNPPSHSQELVVVRSLASGLFSLFLPENQFTMRRVYICGHNKILAFFFFFLFFMCGDIIKLAISRGVFKNDLYPFCKAVTICCLAPPCSYMDVICWRLFRKFLLIFLFSFRLLLFSFFQCTIAFLLFLVFPFCRILIKWGAYSKDQNPVWLTK